MRLVTQSPIEGLLRNVACTSNRRHFPLDEPGVSLHVEEGFNRLRDTCRYPLTLGLVQPHWTFPSVEIQPGLRRLASSFTMPPRRLAASPPRRLAASPPRRLPASPPRRLAASPPRRLAASPPRRLFR